MSGKSITLQGSLDEIMNYLCTKLQSRDFEEKLVQEDEIDGKMIQLLTFEKYMFRENNYVGVYIALIEKEDNQINVHYSLSGACSGIMNLDIFGVYKKVESIVEEIIMNYQK